MAASKLQMEVAAEVRRAGSRGVSASALGARWGLSARSARGRLIRARANVGGIDCYGSKKAARWVADEFVEEFVIRRDLAYKRREAKRARAKRAELKSLEAVRVIVAANDAAPLMANAPRSVFDLARMAA